MRKFTSVHEVSFEDLLEVLQEWENGVLPYDEVQAWAETVFSSEWHEYEKDDPRSVLVEVIQLLEDMYWEPILKKDIPVLRRILAEARNSPANAWRQRDAFVETINWTYRKQQANSNLQKYHDQKLDTISDP